MDLSNNIVTLGRSAASAYLISSRSQSSHSSITAHQLWPLSQQHTSQHLWTWLSTFQQETIEIYAYNFELYRFKVGSVFETNCVEIYPLWVETPHSCVRVLCVDDLILHISSAASQFPRVNCTSMDSLPAVTVTWQTRFNENQFTY